MGPLLLRTRHGTIDVGASEPYGMAIPGTLADTIEAFAPQEMEQFTLIENKQIYDEYLLEEKRPEELVFYHGGFLSPIKQRLIRRLSASIPPEMPRRFWADIDLGGFQMFSQLQSLVPGLRPMRMGPAELRRYRDAGLVHDEDYFQTMEEACQEGRFPQFGETMRLLLEYRITIQQDAFSQERMLCHSGT